MQGETAIILRYRRFFDWNSAMPGEAGGNACGHR